MPKHQPPTPETVAQADQPAPLLDEQGNGEIEIPPEALLRAENRVLRNRNVELEQSLAQHMAVLEILTAKKP